MRAIKYFTNVLPDGRLAIPAEVRRELALRKGEKLEVILSYITVKSRGEEIRSLQKKIQEEAAKKTGGKLSLQKIDRLVHAIRKD
jgi:bifunctional DNA-binding transcriptional regulator/antitoxin component of YhaV-PrlF toxin-antitoxin module